MADDVVGEEGNVPSAVRALSQSLLERANFKMPCKRTDDDVANSGCVLGRLRSNHDVGLKAHRQEQYRLRVWLLSGVLRRIGPPVRATRPGRATVVANTKRIATERRI